jgi:hypothetical protein
MLRIASLGRWILPLVTLGILVVFACGTVSAQTTDVYWQTYFDHNVNQHGLDQNVYIINPGLTGSPISADMGTLCANIYVFDEYQEMLECCSCPVTANGLLKLSVEDLTDNSLTVVPYRGVIKLISSAGPTCDPLQISPKPTLRAFSSHLQDAKFGGSNSYPLYSLTETEFQEAPLSGVEQSDLTTICSFVRYLGTGRGRCDYLCSEPVDFRLP